MNTPVNFCEACGARLSSDTRFCEACGQAVEAAPATVAPPPPFPPPAQPQAATLAAPGRRTPYLVGGGLILILIIGGLGYYYWPKAPDAIATRKSVKVPIPPEAKLGQPPAPPAQTGRPPQDPQYFFYINPKFRYLISFPRNLLVPQGVFPSGAGQRFVAAENRAVLTVWGEYQQMGDSLRKLYEQIIRGPDRTCTYKVCKSDWFVVSGYFPDGRIFYRKTLFRDNMFKSFEITYEKEQKDLYDDIVNHLARSFENTRPVD